LKVESLRGTFRFRMYRVRKKEKARKGKKREV